MGKNITATGQNITMHRGDTKVFEVTVLDNNDLPIDITNCSFNYVVYKITPSIIALTKTTVSGIVITTPLSGIFEVTLDPVDTESLLGYYYHECELTDPAGNISTIFTGSFTILDSKA